MEFTCEKTNTNTKDFVEESKYRRQICEEERKHYITSVFEFANLKKNYPTTNKYDTFFKNKTQNVQMCSNFF